MADTGNIALLRQKYELLSPVMNEKMQRQWAAAEALTRARGGISLVAQATGLSRTTIAAGIRELRADRPPVAPGATPAERGCRLGGGRWPVLQHDPAVREAREALGEPTTRGDPQSP